MDYCAFEAHGITQINIRSLLLPSFYGATVCLRLYSVHVEHALAEYLVLGALQIHSKGLRLAATVPDALSRDDVSQDEWVAVLDRLACVLKTIRGLEILEHKLRFLAQIVLRANYNRVERRGGNFGAS